jgi:glycosyltransferase involved in cell wall biosynthesis
MTNSLPQRSSPEVSVLLCTHNPRPAYLTRVLEALRAQSLPASQWELLLVDSASAEPLAGRIDLQWHPRSQLLRMDQPGKTLALLTAIPAAKAETLIVVDDDNVLAGDYLAQAAHIARAHPNLGAWGGNVVLQFQAPPPDWTRRYWHFLAQQQVQQDVMVCNMELSHPLPVGAGCCVRRTVAQHYAQQLSTSPRRRALGRCGASLMAGEDTDLVLTACELGLQRGLFTCLRLEHLIPPERLEEKYLAELVEGILFSSSLLLMCRDRAKAPPEINWWWRLKFYCDCVTRFGRRRRFYLAGKRAQRRARQVYDGLEPWAET